MRSWMAGFQGSEALVGAGLVGAIGFAGALGGLGWAGLVGGVSIAIVGLAGQQLGLSRRLAEQEAAQRLMSHADAPEEVAQLRMTGDLGNREFFAFLHALKTTTGGEAFESSHRQTSPDQLEPVRPGIGFSLGHDNGWWYAKLVLSGEAGKRLVHGDFPQWRARGRTPEEAVAELMRQCGKARQQAALQQYVARVVSDQS